MISTLLPSGYRLREGSSLDRAILVKFMQRTYRELYPGQDLSHLAQTVEQYLSGHTRLWWVEPELQDNPHSTNVSLPGCRSDITSPVACLWIGNAIDQIYGDRHTYIFLLYVLPNWRRQGIGTALMQWAEKWARERGDRQISLQVFHHNVHALRLYDTLGYQPQSIWMTKSLDN